MADDSDVDAPTLAPTALDGLSLDRVIAFVRAVTGRDPTPEDIADVRAAMQRRVH